MKTPQLQFASVSRILCALVLLFVSVLPALFPPNASAAQITARSLTLVNGATDGGSKPGGVVNHLYSFSVPTTANIASIKFEYCTTAANTPATPTCVTPTGLDTTSATIGSQSFGTAFTVNSTANGAPYLTRATGVSLPAGAYTVQLNTITNPTAVNGETFFSRITTYTTDDATGASTDAGNVTAATNRPIVVTGTMPESLVFCAGQEVGLTSTVPDCSTVTTGSIEFNQLFSPTDTSVSSSQMAASTNAGSGYAIKIHGSTLTSGSNTVTAMNTAGPSVKGVSQFGLNLKVNTLAAAASFPTLADPYYTLEVAPAANGTNYRGQATTGYNVVDEFKFTTGDTVADSANGGAGGTDAQIFTVNYIANVPGSQPAGTYTSTLTYICTPTF